MAFDAKLKHKLGGKYRERREALDKNLISSVHIYLMIDIFFVGVIFKHYNLRLSS